MFFKKEVSQYDLIPHGLEDFTRLSQSNFWNHHFFSKIIEDNFSRKITVVKKGKISNNPEREKIYKKLKFQNLKEKISLYVQKR